jgi:hypothetical protein
MYRRKQMRRRKPMCRRKSIRRKTYKILNFGKYDGQMSLPEAISYDPNWFFYVFENNVFAFDYNGFGKEARDLNFKARNVRIPLPRWKHWRVEYTFEHCGEVLSGFDLIEVSSPEEANPDRLDLSVPHRRSRYRQAGDEALLRDFKIHYFGGQHGRLTRDQCEAFFDNPDNFFEPPKPFGEEEEAEAPRSDLRAILPA